TSKSGSLEARDAIKRRVEEAARFVDPDQLGLSPQCGFASTEEGNILAEDEQWAKLGMIVELAREVWGTSQRVAATRQYGEGNTRKILNRWNIDAVVACAVAAMLLGAASARAADPITIGFGMALTGPLAANGKMSLLAMKIWED